ncbi:tyrosine-type recombinase/integrase [Corynebacterium kutscheri]|uniref:tyrosine-type recombinase/integrase n=1 Tax=Corynebacterium kutscheri TaxID=35755 RepID=UPI0037C01663
MGIRLPSRAQKKDTTLTRAQVDLLVENCRRYRSLVAFLAFTGVRWGEAVALTVGDIDLGASRARIEKTASTVSGRVVVGETKTSQARTIAIPAPAMRLLAPELRGKLPSALIWVNATGGYVTSPSRRSWWHSAVDACRALDGGFPDVTPHDLRHAAASMLVSMGASVMVVQRQLGHASAKMTLDRYSHLFDGDLDAVLSAYENAPSKLRQKR